MAGHSNHELLLTPIFSKMFPLNSSHLKQMHTNTAPHRSLTTDKLLLVGSDNTQKSNLLFQAAVQYSAEGRAVTFICREAMKRLPMSVHGMPRAQASDGARLITMLYLSDVSELLDYLSSVHEKSHAPHVLIVDDLQHYFSQAQRAAGDRSSAKLCAMLVDAAGYITARLHKEHLTESCHLLIATNDNNPAHMHIYRRFFNSVYTIQDCADDQRERSYEILPWSIDKSLPCVGLKFNVQKEIMLQEVFTSKCR